MGVPAVEVCRKRGLDTATFYKLKAEYGGMEVSAANRLHQSEDENGKLKRQLGVRLLSRTTRSVSPTDTGRNFVDQVGPDVQTLHDAMGAPAHSRKPHPEPFGSVHSQKERGKFEQAKHLQRGRVRVVSE